MPNQDPKMKTVSPEPSTPPLRLDSECWSLSVVVAFQMALAMAVAMAAYAMFQHFSLPDVTIKELLLRHLWHVAALGTLIYVCCWICFRWMLWRPLNAVYVHLYGLSKGELLPIRVNTRIMEIHTIVEGINLLIWHIQRSQNQVGLSEVRNKLALVRKSMASSDNACECVSLESVLDELDLTLSALAYATPDPDSDPPTQGNGSSSEEVAPVRLRRVE